MYAIIGTIFMLIGALCIENGVESAFQGNVRVLAVMIALAFVSFASGLVLYSKYDVFE